MDKLTIKTENTVLKFNTQSIVVSPVISVNAKTGVIVLNADDVGADAAGSAEQVQENVDALNLALDLVINDLDNLSDEVDTKASAAAVVQALSTKADLVNGVIPASQLPSYVDDVLVFPTWSAFPVVGEVGKIYVTEDTNKTYRWTGSGYVVIADSIALGETAATAYRGDRGKIAFDHSQSQGNPHNATTSDIPEGNKLYFTEDRVRQTLLTGLNISIATPVVATDNIVQAVGKLQGQLNSGSSGFTWINTSTISGFTLTSGVTQNATPLKFAKKDGLLWISGALEVSTLISTGTKVFSLTNSSWFIENFAGANILPSSSFMITAYYNNLSGRTSTSMWAQVYMYNSEMYLRLQSQISVDGGALVFSPTLIGRLINP